MSQVRAIPPVSLATAPIRGWLSRSLTTTLTPSSAKRTAVAYRFPDLNRSPGVRSFPNCRQSDRQLLPLPPGRLHQPVKTDRHPLFLRSIPATFHPSLLNLSATTRPMVPAAPVTTATGEAGLILLDIIFSSHQVPELLGTHYHRRLVVAI